MLLFLQALLVLVPAALGLLFLLLILGPAVGGMIHAHTFTLKPWHAVIVGVCAALALAFAVAFGWVSAP